LNEQLLEFIHLVNRHALKKTVHTAIYHGHLLCHRPRRILRLNKELLVFAATVNDLCGNGVDVSAELCERFKLTELRLSNLQCAGNLFHRLDLSVAAYARHGYAHIDRRTNALVEKGRLEEYLTVRD